MTRTTCIRRSLFTVLLALHIVAPLAILAQPLRQVRILATGGTIAGQARSDTDPSYTSGQLPVDALINAVPEASKLATITGEQVCQIGSQDMNDAIWLTLARRINQLFASSPVDGIVITHGTDTMEETAFFLHLTVHSRKPVVLTGSMRPATAIGADGPRNLYDAVAVASDPQAQNRGVLVVFNDDVHSARDVVKTNTTDVETFQSPLAGLIGVTAYGKTSYLRHPERAHTADSEFSVDTMTALPRVDILYAHANMSPDLVTASVAAGAKGIVVAGVGNGNMRASVIDALRAAVKQGVAVVRSTRVATGIVGRAVEVDDDGLGFVASDNLNPAKSRVLLQLALTRTQDPKQIQQMFYKY
jgi:L-asparaginase